MDNTPSNGVERVAQSAIGLNIFFNVIVESNQALYVI